MKILGSLLAVALIAISLFNELAHRTSVAGAIALPLGALCVGAVLANAFRNSTKRENLLINALRVCADQFSTYEQSHLAKNPPDREKAQRNREFARFCRQVIGQ